MKKHDLQFIKTSHYLVLQFPVNSYWVLGTWDAQYSVSREAQILPVTKLGFRRQVIKRQKEGCKNRTAQVSLWKLSDFSLRNVV